MNEIFKNNKGYKQLGVKGEEKVQCPPTIIPPFFDFQVHRIRIQGWDERLEYQDGMKDQNTRMG